MGSLRRYEVSPLSFLPYLPPITNKANQQYNMKTTNENESLLNELTRLEADLSNQVKEAEQKLKSLRANHARISKLINLLNGLGNLINQDQNKVHVTEAAR